GGPGPGGSGGRARVRRVPAGGLAPVPVAAIPSRIPKFSLAADRLGWQDRGERHSARQQGYTISFLVRFRVGIRTALLATAAMLGLSCDFVSTLEGSLCSQRGRLH